MQVGGGLALTEEWSEHHRKPARDQKTHSLATPSPWPHTHTHPPHGQTDTHTQTHTLPGNAGGASLRPRAHSHSRRWPARQVEPLTCCHC